MNAGCAGNTLISMENKEKNLLVVLSNRRIQNFKSQFKSVVLEGLEIFGPTVVSEVYDECQEIYKEFVSLGNE